MTRKYDKEFKLNAVKLYLSNGQSLDRVAADPGISRASLGKWVNVYRNHGGKSFPGSGNSIDQELQALKRELHLVRQERDILKKAVAIFSVTPGKGTNL